MYKNFEKLINDENSERIIRLTEDLELRVGQNGLGHMIL